ncbi:DUF3800 domain-containing protein [Roseibium album]|uniref:DUF3800 domain-containing protein n=1 Tax=Roseibium album TaxID=311410 RepID=UPI00248FD95E|nr:DUF3800 domain-containing protein [Roseibium album]
MQVFFLDDSRQRNCNRERMGPLVAVGGVSLSADCVRALDQELDRICREEFGFPDGEPFKWSPARDHWMRANLVEERRYDFFRRILTVSREQGALGRVVIVDSNRRQAHADAPSSEIDVLTLALERFDYSLRADDLGIVIVARPSGGRRDEDKFLSDCAELLSSGTRYSEFNRVALDVLTMPSHSSRLLQLADLVVSITTAMIAGHTEFAGNVFEEVKNILQQSQGRIGGVGVKIHPDYTYANLYHWVLGDEYFWRNNVGVSMPVGDRPYRDDGRTY